MLLTLDVPLDARAQRFALETALGSGCPLVLCDAVPVGPQLGRRRAAHARAPEADASLRAAAGEARSLGVQVDELIFHSPRPLAAATTLCARARRRAARVRPLARGGRPLALPLLVAAGTPRHALPALAAGGLSAGTANLRRIVRSR